MKPTNMKKISRYFLTDRNLFYGMDNVLNVGSPSLSISTDYRA